MGALQSWLRFWMVQNSVFHTSSELLLRRSCGQEQVANVAMEARKGKATEVKVELAASARAMLERARVVEVVAGEVGDGGEIFGALVCMHSIRRLHFRFVVLP